MHLSSQHAHGSDLHPGGRLLQTIENTREADVTMIAPEDAEVEADDAQDEFASACDLYPHRTCSQRPVGSSPGSAW